MTDALAAVPDEPACVEARGMMLSGRGRVAWRNEHVIVFHAQDERLASIVGPFRWLDVTPVLNMLGPGVEVVTREAEFAQAGAVPVGWCAERAIVYEEPARLPELAVKRPVTFFSEADPPDLRHVPHELREELEAALAFSPLAAALDGDVPVSFCYAGWETESWWDVSIDTLGPWRNRGYAAAASIALMTHMRRHGKRAVWAALESNVASLAVARRLGFHVSAHLVIVTSEPRKSSV
jgi:hypothetical protein